MNKIRSSDAVLWGFPLYILHVHAGYKRFIELVFERNTQEVFKGKYTAALSTSIHFFDHTAHNYIHAICDDLQMRFVDAYAPGNEIQLPVLSGWSADPIINVPLLVRMAILISINQP